MVRTRQQFYATASTQDVMERLVPPDRQVKGNERKHFVYYAEGKTLVLVGISKNKWGLILVDEQGNVKKGQYVARHRVSPHRCKFDGTHFYWFAFMAHEGYLFARGKSVAPYFSVVEPVIWADGWHVKDWHGAGGAHDIMYDLSSIPFQRVAPP